MSRNPFFPLIEARHAELAEQGLPDRGCLIDSWLLAGKGSLFAFWIDGVTRSQMVDEL